jgi:hypothetical protein
MGIVHFVDMLRLLCLQSLGDNEILLRGRKWVRCKQPWELPASLLSPARAKEAEMLTKLLLNSIQVIRVVTALTL